MIVIFDGSELLEDVDKAIRVTSISEIMVAKDFVSMILFHYPGSSTRFWDDVAAIHPDYYRKVSYRDYGDIDDIHARFTAVIETYVVEAFNSARREGMFNVQYSGGTIDGKRLIIELTEL